MVKAFCQKKKLTSGRGTRISSHFLWWNDYERIYFCCRRKFAVDEFHFIGFDFIFEVEGKRTLEKEECHQFSLCMCFSSSTQKLLMVNWFLPSLIIEDNFSPDGLVHCTAGVGRSIWAEKFAFRPFSVSLWQKRTKKMFWSRKKREKCTKCFINISCLFRIFPSRWIVEMSASWMKKCRTLFFLPFYNVNAQTQGT